MSNGYVLAMTANQHAHTVSAPFDAQLSALLGGVSAHCSIVDKLMSMPSAELDLASEWDRAVARRLERKVADAMRGAIEGETGKRSA